MTTFERAKKFAKRLSKWVDSKLARGANSRLFFYVIFAEAACQARVYRSLLKQLIKDEGHLSVIYEQALLDALHLHDTVYSRKQKALKREP